jgi:hypothetical protein
MTTIGVAHLVRASNGTAPFQRFLDSYRTHPAGCDHELLLLCKGFRTRAELRPYQELLGEIRCQALWLPDVGLDIRPYFMATRRFNHSYLCFLNSFSVLLADNWLAKLAQSLARPGVGLVGASGSWESGYTNVLVATALRQMAGPRALWVPRLIAYRALFAPFPNPHIRTTSFMAKAEVLRRIHWPHVRVKRDAHRFEGGRNSITRQVRRMGLRTLVVGRDGAGYESPDWPCSGTFRQGAQENLLVADNRTEAFQRADARQREHLSRMAWGDAVSEAKGAML